MYVSLIIFSANTATHLFIDVLNDDEPITYEPGNKKSKEKEIILGCSDGKPIQERQNVNCRQDNESTISEIIDVTWMLRKTSFIEGDAKKASQEQNVLFRKKEASTRKVTS